MAKSTLVDINDIFIVDSNNFDIREALDHILMGIDMEEAVSDPVTEFWISREYSLPNLSHVPKIFDSGRCQIKHSEVQKMLNDPVC